MVPALCTKRWTAESTSIRHGSGRACSFRCGMSKMSTQYECIRCVTSVWKLKNHDGIAIPKRLELSTDFVGVLRDHVRASSDSQWWPCACRHATRGSADVPSRNIEVAWHQGMTCPCRKDDMHRTMCTSRFDLKKCSTELCMRPSGWWLEENPQKLGEGVSFEGWMSSPQSHRGE